MKLSTFFGRSDESRSMSFQDVWGMGYDMSGLATKSGKPVNADTAMTVSAVYGSVRILSENISTLPIDTYTRNGSQRESYQPRPEWLDFTVGPFDKIAVMGQIMVSLLLDGNAYVATYREATGAVVWMEVLDPKQVEPQRVGAEVRYSVNGQPSVDRYDILHITGMMMPGDIKGISPITASRESIGLSIAATEFGAAFFGNGAIPGTVVEVPGQLSEQGVKQLKSAWNEKHQGSGNAHRLAVVTEGAKFSKITVDPDDAQFLQTRQFQVTDIARIYGVPPHLLADASGSTSWGSGLAEQNTMFVQQSLRPWVERIQQAFTWLARSEGRPPNLQVEMNLDGLLSGDMSAAANALGALVRSGYDPTDACRALNITPIKHMGFIPITLKTSDENVPLAPDPEVLKNEGTP